MKTNIVWFEDYGYLREVHLRGRTYKKPTKGSWERLFQYCMRCRVDMSFGYGGIAFKLGRVA